VVLITTAQGKPAAAPKKKEEPEPVFEEAEVCAR
jgi:hypothetical protein